MDYYVYANILGDWVRLEDSVLIDGSEVNYWVKNIFKGPRESEFIEIDYDLVGCQLTKHIKIHQSLIAISNKSGLRPSQK